MERVLINLSHTKTLAPGLGRFTSPDNAHARKTGFFYLSRTRVALKFSDFSSFSLLLLFIGTIVAHLHCVNATSSLSADLSLSFLNFLSGSKPHFPLSSVYNNMFGIFLEFADFSLPPYKREKVTSSCNNTGAQNKDVVVSFLNSLDSLYKRVIK